MDLLSALTSARNKQQLNQPTSHASSAATSFLAGLESYQQQCSAQQVHHHQQQQQQCQTNNDNNDTAGCNNGRLMPLTTFPLPPFDTMTATMWDLTNERLICNGGATAGGNGNNTDTNISNTNVNATSNPSNQNCNNDAMNTTANNSCSINVSNNSMNNFVENMSNANTNCQTTNNVNMLESAIEQLQSQNRALQLALLSTTAGNNSSSNNTFDDNSKVVIQHHQHQQPQQQVQQQQQIQQHQQVQQQQQVYQAHPQLMNLQLPSGFLGHQKKAPTPPPFSNRQQCSMLNLDQFGSSCHQADQLQPQQVQLEKPVNDMSYSQKRESMLPPPPSARMFVPSERRAIAMALVKAEQEKNSSEGGAKDLEGSSKCNTSKQSSSSPQQITKVLQMLGSTLRSKADPYVDAANFDDPGMPRCARGGVVELFPDKLHRMLREMEENGEQDIASFLPHGRAFRVHDIDQFVDKILPRYFSDQSRWSSFSRQLQLYGFLRVSWGVDIDAYYHELFLQGKPKLCHYMRRVGVPRGFDRRRFKLPQGEDPDFYSMPSLSDMKKNATVSATDDASKNTSGAKAA